MINTSYLKSASNVTNKYAKLRYSLLILLLFWLCWLLFLGILQLLNTGIGTAIWPKYEDVNYYRMLEVSGSKGIPSLFWKLDARNPINPWFWVALFSTIEHSYGYELFAVSRLVDLILGLAIFLLFDAITRSRCQLFPITSAIAVMIWPYARNDHAIWAFNVGLALSIFSLYCYCRYHESQRKKAQWLILSVLLYFITITTYTIHLWGFISIPFLSLLLHKQDALNRPLWYSRFAIGCIDMAWYICFLAVFILIWDTTSPFSAPARNQMSLIHIAKQLPTSIAYLCFSPIDLGYLSLIFQNWEWRKATAIAITLTLAYAIVFYKILNGKSILNLDDNHLLPLIIELYTSIAVLAALAGGVIQVESTTTTWFPGSRTPMVQKIVQPCLGIIIALIITKAFFKHNLKTSKHLLFVLFVCFLTTGSMLALSKNQQEMLITTNQKNILKQILTPKFAELYKGKDIVIIFDKKLGPFFPSFQARKHLAPRLAPQIKSISFVSPLIPAHKIINYKSLILHDDQKGVAMRYSKQIADFTIAPYHNIGFFKYDLELGLQSIINPTIADFKDTDASVLRTEHFIPSCLSGTTNQ